MRRWYEWERETSGPLQNVHFGLMTVSSEQSGQRERHARELPAYVTRVTVPHALVGQATIVVIAALVVWFVNHPYFPYLYRLTSEQFVTAALLAAAAGLVLLHQRMQIRLAEHVRDWGCRVCPRCLYDLRSIDDKLPCPECGDATPREIAKEQWRNWFRKLELAEGSEKKSEVR